MKTLGIYLSEDLSWNYPVNHVQTKVNRINGLLNQHQHSFSTKIKIIIQKSFFVSTINHFLAVWGTTSLQNKQKLVIAPKRVIRHFADFPTFFHTTVCFEKSSILKQSLLQNYRLIVTYNTAVRENSTSLLSLFNLKPHTSAYNTRNNESWKITTLHISYGNQSSQHILPAFLNNFLCHGINVKCIC